MGSMVDALKWLSKNNSDYQPTDMEDIDETITDYLGTVDNAGDRDMSSGNNWLGQRGNATPEVNNGDDEYLGNAAIEQKRKAQGMDDALKWLRAKKGDTDGIMDDTKLQLDDFSDFQFSEDQDDNGMAVALDWLQTNSNTDITGPSKTSKLKKGKSDSKITKREQENNAKSMVDALKWLSKNNSDYQPTDMEDIDETITDYLGTVDNAGDRDMSSGTNWLGQRGNATPEVNNGDDEYLGNAAIEQKRKAQGMDDALKWL